MIDLENLYDDLEDAVEDKFGEGLEDYDLDSDVEESESLNTYLVDEEKGMRLISELMRFNNNNKAFYAKMKQFDKLLRHDFLKLSSKIKTEQEAEIYRQLLGMREKLMESKKINLIDRKVIIGLGGGFSAGKSKFINSILGGADILPEDQTTTTCIPTYIVSGVEKRGAYTFTNNEVDLDQEAIQALTHAFYEKYNLSFSQIIRNLVIQTEALKYPNIIFLDTPGYTKSDNFRKADNTDAYIAKQHLQFVDFLIWVMDSDNGTIKESDLEFIQSLNMHTPILFVFNKADKITEEQRHEIIVKAKTLLSERGIRAFGVTAYTSVGIGHEYEGDLIRKFLRDINDYYTYYKVFEEELDQILESYRDFFDKKNKELSETKQVLEELIKNAYDVSKLRSLSDLHKQIGNDVIFYNFRKKEFDNISKKIKILIEEIIQVG